MSKRFSIYFYSLLPAIILACLVFVSFPYIFKPKYEKQIMHEAVQDSKKIAYHFISHHPTELTESQMHLPDNFEYCIDQDIDLFNLYKVRLFNSEGIIIYSSKNSELGTVNHKPYFNNIVSKGTVFSKIVKKKEFTASGSISPIDVVETYVPVVKDGKFLGAYEIYLDITSHKKNIESVCQGAYILSSIVTILFIVLIFILAYRIDNKCRKQQVALSEIKNLQKILPVCSSCKKIRDDKNFWNSVDSYISEHANSECGLCEGCSKKTGSGQGTEES